MENKIKYEIRREYSIGLKRYILYLYKNLVYTGVSAEDTPGGLCRLKELIDNDKDSPVSETVYSVEI
jgi:hypothetical protein